VIRRKFTISRWGGWLGKKKKKRALAPREGEQEGGSKKEGGGDWPVKGKMDSYCRGNDDCGSG